jgi:hypothetical protein
VDHDDAVAATTTTTATTQMIEETRVEKEDGGNELNRLRVHTATNTFDHWMEKERLLVGPARGGSGCWQGGDNCSWTSLNGHLGDDKPDRVLCGRPGCRSCRDAVSSSRRWLGIRVALVLCHVLRPPAVMMLLGQQKTPLAQLVKKCQTLTQETFGRDEIHGEPMLDRFVVQSNKVVHTTVASSSEILRLPRTGEDVRRYPRWRWYRHHFESCSESATIGEIMP